MEAECSSETYFFNVLYGVIFQMTEFFIATAVNTSNPTNYAIIYNGSLVKLSKNKLRNGRVETKTMKIMISMLWGELPYSQVNNYRRFGRRRCLHLGGGRVT
jgi:hypothetical protein